MYRSRVGRAANGKMHLPGANARSGRDRLRNSNDDYGFVSISFVSISFVSIGFISIGFISIALINFAA